MDFPNLHRRLTGGGPEEYEALWIRKVREARQSGIRSKDPYCRLDRTLFKGIEELAVSHVRHNMVAAFRGANGALCQETPTH